MAKKTVIVLVGPTAVGKTAVAVELALTFNIAIINADSRQVFKDMKIGTARPSIEEMKGVKHYFVGDRRISDEISAGIFEKEALSVLSDEFEQNDLCLVSGGSGLYIEALCLGLDDFPKVDPKIRLDLMGELKERGVEKLYEELKRIDPAYAFDLSPGNSQRIVRALEIYRASGEKYSNLRLGTTVARDFNVIYLGLERPREELYERINARMDKMIAAGLFEEALSLIEYRDKNALQTVGYSEIFMYADGLIDKKEAVRILKRNSRRYAKRQITWFKRNPEIQWFHPDMLKEMQDLIKQKLYT